MSDKLNGLNFSDELDILASIIGVRMPTEEELLHKTKQWESYIQPLLLDQWSEELMAISIPTTFMDFPLEIAENWWKKEIPWSEDDAKFASEIDKHLNWNKKFFRLNSRSSKDMTFNNEPTIACSGREVLYSLRGSERMLEDFSNFIRSDLKPKICFRDYLPHLKKNQEYRLFIKEGKLLAVSAYLGVKPRAEFQKDRNLINRFFEQTLLPLLPVQTLVADVFISYDYRIADHDNPAGEYVKLLELNPYWLSDPMHAESYGKIEQGIDGIAFNDSVTCYAE